MRTIPFGYKLVSGKAVVDATEAVTLKQFYTDYLLGMSLTNAAKKAGLTGLHCSAKRVLSNRHYLGDEFYPAIIDEKIFNQAQEALVKRAAQLGRLNRKRKPRKLLIPTNFSILDKKIYIDDPFKEAAELYKLIRIGEEYYGISNDNTC